MRYLYASLAAAMIAAAALPAAAGTLLVPQQFSTIQAALNAAKPYDTVLVSAKPKGGVYSEVRGNHHAPCHFAGPWQPNH